MLPVLETVEFKAVRLDFVLCVMSFAEFEQEFEEQSDPEMVVNFLLWYGLQQTPAVWFWDRMIGDVVKLDQVAVLEDGTPIIMDQGSVIYVSDIPTEARKQYDLDCIIADQFYRSHSGFIEQFSYLNEGGDWKIDEFRI